jgi:hypothetical protein
MGPGRNRKRRCPPCWESKAELAAPRPAEVAGRGRWWEAPDGKTPSLFLHGQLSHNCLYTANSASKICFCLCPGRSTVRTFAGQKHQVPASFMSPSLGNRLPDARHVFGSQAYTWSYLGHECRTGFYIEIGAAFFHWSNEAKGNRDM